MILYHVSEEPAIERFEPRSSEYTDYPVVWAITRERLPNYLLPRDCPRVTYYAGTDTSAEDIERFLDDSSAVIAVESGWVERIRSCRLYCYHLPGESFSSLDECAGYYVSRESVAPVGVDFIGDAMAELVRRGIELRLVPDLWPLRDAVVASTLQFSIIRMRNAAPRTARSSQ